jgi:prepilin-type N-terminal cleavage/methylation domain-containing protein
MNRWEEQQGFTIVELLIVVVVIAILAAITIVSYNGITNRANDASVQADLRTLGQQVEQYRTLGDGTLPASIPASVNGAKANHGAYGAHYVPTTGSEYNLLYCRTSSTGDFGFVAASKSGKIFIYTGTGVKEGVGPLTTYTTTCSQNGLPAGGSWLYSNSTWLI